MPPGSGRGGLALGVAGAAVIASALVAATLVLGTYVFVGDRGAGGDIVILARALALCSLGIAVLGVVLFLAPSRPTVSLVLAFALLAGVRLLTVALLEGSLASDWRAYHRLATGWTLGAPAIANRPMGYPILLGETYRIFGIDPEVGAYLNLLLGLAGAGLLAGWLSMVGGRSAAAVGVALLGLAPSQAMYGLLIGTEILYSTLLLAVVVLATIMLRLMATPSSTFRLAMVAAAAATGLVLGSSAYVRTTSLVLVPFFAVLPFLSGSSRRRALPVGLAVLLGASVAVLPAFVINATQLDRVSPMPSTTSGWQLYVGANVAAFGRRTEADERRVSAAVDAYQAGQLPREYAHGIFDPETLRQALERDEAAFSLAIERIRRDGILLAAIAPVKHGIAWGPGDSPVGWIEISGSDRRLASMLSQLWWVGVLAGAVLWYSRRWRHQATTGLVMGAIIVPIALSLLPLEVQPRYHEYVVPILAGLAALWLMPAVGVELRTQRRPPRCSS